MKDLFYLYTLRTLLIKVGGKGINLPNNEVLNNFFSNIKIVDDNDLNDFLLMLIDGLFAYYNNEKKYIEIFFGNNFKKEFLIFQNNIEHIINKINFLTKEEQIKYILEYMYEYVFSKSNFDMNKKRELIEDINSLKINYITKEKEVGDIFGLSVDSDVLNTTKFKHIPFETKKLVLIGGMTNHGKSLLLFNSINELILNNKGFDIIVFSTAGEYTETQFILKLLSNYYGEDLLSQYKDYIYNLKIFKKEQKIKTSILEKISQIDDDNKKQKLDEIVSVLENIDIEYEIIKELEQKLDEYMLELIDIKEKIKKKQQEFTNKIYNYLKNNNLDLEFEFKTDNIVFKGETDNHLILLRNKYIYSNEVINYYNIRQKIKDALIKKRSLESKFIRHKKDIEEIKGLSEEKSKKLVSMLTNKIKIFFKKGLREKIDSFEKKLNNYIQKYEKKLNNNNINLDINITDLYFNKLKQKIVKHMENNKNKPTIVFLDYIQDVHTDISGSEISFSTMNAIGNELKNLVQNFNINFFVLSQLNNPIQGRDSNYINIRPNWENMRLGKDVAIKSHYTGIIFNRGKLQGRINEDVKILNKYLINFDELRNKYGFLREIVEIITDRDRENNYNIGKKNYYYIMPGTGELVHINDEKIVKTLNLNGHILFVEQLIEFYEGEENDLIDNDDSNIFLSEDLSNQQQNKTILILPNGVSKEQLNNSIEKVLLNDNEEKIGIDEDYIIKQKEEALKKELNKEQNSNNDGMELIDMLL